MNNSSTKILVFILVIITLLSGYNYFQKPFLKLIETKINQPQAPEVVLEPTPSQEKLAFEKLSTNEKIWQIISLPVSLKNEKDASSSAQMDFIYQNKPGLVTIFGSGLNLETVRDFTNELPVSDLGLTPLVSVDHEGGTVQRLTGEGFSVLPAWSALCLETTGEKISLFEESARELRSAGINIVFAPVVDVPREGSFLKTRACSNQLASLSSAENYIKSFGEQGILPVVKHYPGIGGVTKDLHFYKEDVYPGSQDTVPFEKIFAAFPNIGVMSAHVVIPDRTKGLPCSLSPLCLDPFPVYFPDVTIFSDALEMKSAITQDENGEDVPLAETARLAVLAGNNVLVFGEKIDYDELTTIVDFLVKEYDDNPEFKEKVDNSVYKIIDKKIFD